LVQILKEFDFSLSAVLKVSLYGREFSCPQWPGSHGQLRHRSF